MGSKRTILVIEDEPTIAETVHYALKTEGFSVFGADLAQKGLAILNSETVDLVILDIGLPDQNGFEVIKKIREASSVPVIFLTARSEEIDRVVGLEIGADDYVVKPFSPRELVARVKAVLRRQEKPVSVDSKPLQSAFRVDIDKCKIYYFESPLTLSRYEFDILKVLITKPGRVFSRDQLMELVWEDPLASQDRTIDSHIKNIRNILKKIKDDVDPIQTHRGLGYSLKESF